jgi:hypothetical protein
MITILQTENVKSRTFGWVQNPSDFRKLCNVVAVFDPSSLKHNEIKNTVIPALVSLENGRDALIAALNANPLRISYLHLVGTGRSERATAPCNAIVQAAVQGQGSKQFTDNWTADGFVRWAHCLGFIKYGYADDAFSITESGLRLSAAHGADEQLSEDEHKIIVDAMLSYPPAIRVLSLLAEENAHMTKFEIGKQLGFVGEGGFTSMPQSIFVRSLSGITNTVEKNKMRNNWEGSSDKYARMIARWLSNLDLVEQIGKTVSVTVGNITYSETVGQAYIITAQGLTALRRAQGASRHRRIPKTICYEMLATKGADRDYLRNRRSRIIELLVRRGRTVTVSDIQLHLSASEITAPNEVIHDDILGFQNIGLDVSITAEGYTWRDTINDFVIPVRNGVIQSERERVKDTLRGRITQIPHDYLSLLDLAYDSSQNRLFEMKTLQLLTEEFGYGGLHLGGSRKPDGIIYTDGLADNYGVIIDTKAYSRGYNLPIGQADEMQRYVQENQHRDVYVNPNKWWENFGEDVRRFYFMFVSGHFIGRYQDRIDRVARITETKGAAVKIYNLLLAANDIKNGISTLTSVENCIFQ